MAAKLYVDTQKIIRYVEQELKITIRVCPLDILSMERNEFTKWHIHSKNDFTLFYNPAHPFFNYEVAHAVLKMLRICKSRKDLPFSPGINQKTLAYASTRMIKELKLSNTKVKEKALPLMENLYYKLVDFLVQVPGNCWNTKYIYDHYPRLKKESLQLLDFVYKKKYINNDFALKDRLPSIWFRASNGLHCAFCFFIDELIGKRRYSKVYAGTEIEKLGFDLRKMITKDKGRAGDIEVMKAWVKVLGLKGWVTFGKG